MSVKHLFLAGLIVSATTAGAQIVNDNTAPRAIDVVVTDRSLTHIKGLTQSDFQIFEDGKPREITKFAEMSYEAGAADTQPSRNILLIFDETSISLASRRVTVDALKDFVNTRVRPIDKVMVVTIAGIGGVFPSSGWTSNKEKLIESLNKAQDAAIGNRSKDLRTTEKEIQDMITVDRETGGNAGITFDTLLNSGRAYASTVQHEAEAVGSGISQALAFLGNGPGKKIAVVAGGGLSTRPGSEIF